MTPRQDPYRVLGLVPGSTAGEIRSAYRRLAKLNHPDTAGERSLPRFLAIKAAYEELVDGEGRLRTRNWPGRSGGPGPWRPSGPPANRASREAWRARRAGGATGGEDQARAGSSGGQDPRGGSASAGGPGPKAGSSTNAGPRAKAGSNARPGPNPKAGTGPKAGPTPRAGGRPRTAERRTARPGSTTYDEAAQPLDPSWEGGSWYGASSGRYWTLNPREYADPRKHGPEYQERAKRAAQVEAARRAGEPQPPDPPIPGPPPSPLASPSASSAADPLPRYRRAGRHPSTPDGP